MKFYCDRCKTRYTIADERVRGKVLKIRCKNCANIITVREGQSEAPPTDARGDAIPRASDPGHSVSTRRPTASNTGRLVPSIARTATSTSPAPIADIYDDAAAASDQLEDEWYVSLDGDQSGPFTLGQAQAWVAGKTATDDLHCWTEGFDDWLPVEKVSHFRGLRTRRINARAPTLPPPIPADAGKRDDARPLFASTMAALEADGAAAAADAARLPPRLGKPRAPTPPPVPPKSSVAAQLDNVASKGGVAPAPRVAVAMFDGGERDDDGDDGDDDPDGGGNALDGLAQQQQRKQAAAAPPAASDDDDDDLSIGEVSRVVRIADLAKQAMRPTRSAAAQPVARLQTAANPVIRTGNTGMVAKVPGIAYSGGAPEITAEQLELSAPPAPRHNAGIYLVAGALLAALVAAIIVVIVAQSGGGVDGPATVGGAEYDDLGRRIDDPLRRVGSGSTTGSALVASGTGSGGRKPNTTVRNPGSNGTATGSATTGPEVLGADGKPLRAMTSDDVEAMSRKMSAGTTRCWEQAQKRDLFIDAKRIKVTLAVDKTGTVQQVSVSDFAADFLGQCLVSAVKRWKFVPSTSGITAQFTLAFTK